MDADILTRLEACFSRAGDATCIIDASRDAHERITYRQLRSRSAYLARALQQRGITRGGYCATDMDNCPAFVYLLVAAAYGGFTLVLQNVRLTDAEKAERLRDVTRAQGLDKIECLDEAAVLEVMGLAGDAAADPALPTDDAAALSHWAQRGVGAFDGLADGVVMFTSGTSGKPKAAALSWNNLQGAATASNASINTPGEGMWQLALPLYHVGGLEIVIRSLLNVNPFILYRRFDAARVLRDARTYGATHVSVVDKMLQDMVAAEAADNDDDCRGALAAYECILLGGAAPNLQTLKQAREAGARVFASYGMTETCSQIASAVVGRDYRGELSPLPGYDVAVLAPDASGLGRLAVKGPGVFDGYLNARAAFTADGYFLTGDSARMAGRRIVVAERTGDMFVSGGENIYPEEIRSKLLQAPGVTDAYVFGIEDADWGRRPVAFVEASQVARQPGYNAQKLADEVRVSLAARIARIYMPDHIAVVPDFPRTAVGKVDRTALRLFYAERIEVVRVELWRIKQPLRTPVRTAKTHMRERESIIVRVTDSAGRTGIGEDVAFSTDWYLPETIDSDLTILEKRLIPHTMKHVFMHPSQISPFFDLLPGTASHPLACAAVESALWDLYGKVMGVSVRRLIGAREQVTEHGALREVPAGNVLGGAVVSIGSVDDVLKSVQSAVDAGYTRVKLKVKPGHDVKVVRAVRARFPQLEIMLDANQSFTEDDVDVLKALQEFDIACLEEPLDPKHKPSVGPQELFARLARLQRVLSVPICLDESWTSVHQLETQLDAHPELRCVAMKLGKFGGVQPALAFYHRARNRGITLWMGGMYDTGVSKRLHAAFAMLPGMNLPGDINDTSRYFAQDITVPPFALHQGELTVNPAGHEAGLGCELNDEVLQQLAVYHRVFE